MARLVDMAWCALVPILLVAIYLAVGVGMVSVVGQPILGTAILGGIVALAVMAVRWLRPQWLAYEPAARTRSSTSRFGWLIAGGAVLAFLAGQSLALWLYSIGGSTGFDESTGLRRDAGVAVTLLLALVAAPAGEEALFRGVLYPLLRRRVSIVASVLVSTAVFALMHGNVVQFAAAWPLAVLLALLYERTRTVWPCMLVHLGFNLAATFTPPVLLTPLADPVSALLLTAAFMGCVLVIYQSVIGQTSPGPPESKKEHMEDGPQTT